MIVRIWAVAVLVTAVAIPIYAQRNEAPGPSVSMLVTAEGKRGNTPPSLQQQDIRVTEAGGPRNITELAPMREDASLQLLLLIDDSSAGSFDTEIATIKQWINSLPASVEIGVAYMRNGLAGIVHPLSTDHVAVADAVRLTAGAGGADVSPYDSLSDAVKRWPKSNAQRKEIVMISSGIEALGGGWAPDNPYVNKGIADAQRAGVVVFAIYNPSFGHWGHVFWRDTMGQTFLSQMADETGGEAYITTFSAPVSFQPFLDEISGRLQNQYRLTFIARAESKSGLQPVRVTVADRGNGAIAAADKVFVPASK
ncbi:MAG: hypothetical protein JO061_18560 [Acidobacteriaceae bacterium]|nr:hypothetical protein [Acidobacteriaceae bacterium]